MKAGDGRLTFLTGSVPRITPIHTLIPIRMRVISGRTPNYGEYRSEQNSRACHHCTRCRQGADHSHSRAVFHSLLLHSCQRADVVTNGMRPEEQEAEERYVHID